MGILDCHVGGKKWSMMGACDEALGRADRFEGDEKFRRWAYIEVGSTWYAKRDAEFIMRLFAMSTLGRENNS